MNEHIIHLNDFIPHGVCWLWDWKIITAQLVSNLLIVIAYYVIPLALLKIVIKHKIGRINRLPIMFSTFILLCGTTHLMDIILIYRPWFWLDSIIRFSTGIVSVITAIELVRISKVIITMINKYNEMHDKVESILNKPI
jgi:hypothetical protein